MAVRLSALSTSCLSPLRKIPGTHFCYSLSQHQGHSAGGRIRSTEKSNDLIRTWTRNLPACSIVPQPTMLPHAPSSRLTYDLSNDTVNNSDQMVSNDRMANEQWTGKNMKRSSHGLFKVLHHNFPGRSEINHKNLSKDIFCLSWCLNWHLMDTRRYSQLSRLTKLITTTALHTCFPQYEGEHVTPCKNLKSYLYHHLLPPW
jgi:hypothetical protein